MVQPAAQTSRYNHSLTRRGEKQSCTLEPSNGGLNLEMGGHRDRRTEKQEGHRGTQARGYEGCCTAVEDDSMSTSFQIQTELQHLANTAIGFMEDLTRLKSSGALTMFGTLLSLCTELSAHPGLASTAPSATCASPATAALSADSPVKMVSVELTNHSGKGTEH